MVIDAALRRATASDVDSIVSVFRRARETCMPYLPRLHTIADDIKYFTDVVAGQGAVWVAEKDRIAGFCAYHLEWLDHLYVDPAHQRKGIGSALLAIATREHRVLNLWVFQKNAPAIRFYEKHGFMLVKKTDGSENEEREPDALYRRVDR